MKLKTQKRTYEAMQLPGALALAAAGAATQANAATVQITFTGSYISTSLGNQLDTDFGDDSVANFGGVLESKQVQLFDEGSSVFAQAAFGYRGSISAFTASVWLRGAGSGVDADSAGAGVALRSLVAVNFTDTNIRSGAPTNGWLDITAVANEPGDKRLTVNRLIFDDATGGAITGLTANDAAYTTYSAVPEPSSLALLALGAGGLLTRRRRSQAA
jgi:hypothetical protein